MQQNPLNVTYDGAVAIITFNRPDAGNAIDLRMAQMLYAAADQLHQGGSSRAIMLCAKGALFSGGGDIQAFARAVAGGADQAAAYVAELATTIHRALLHLMALEVPIVAAVQGPAAGAAMGLVLAADFSYLAPAAKLVPAYAAIGLCGDNGVTWMLPRLCGIRKATEILMLNTPIGPTEAVSFGLVTGALSEDGDAFYEAVLDRTRRLACGPRQAFGAMRSLLRAAATSTFEDQLNREAVAMAQLAASPELPEALAAMKEKRKPIFT